MTAADPTLLWHHLVWRLRCLEATPTEFQALFERVMSKVDQDFVPVRPYGKMGDLKNDGMLFHKGVVHQVYAPDEYKQADLIAKIEEDFDGAVAHWHSHGLTRWVFVYVVRRGVPPDVPRILYGLQAKHPAIEIDHMSSDRLWELVRALPAQARDELLGPAIERVADGAFVLLQEIMSPISEPDAVAALAPAAPYGPALRIGPAVEPGGWEAVANFQAEFVARLRRDAGDHPPRFAVFSLSPIPLAVHLGFVLSDRLRVDLFQFDRDRRSWVWESASDVPDDIAVGPPTLDANGSQDIVLRVSLSATVRPDQTAALVPKPALAYDITVPRPDVMWLKHPSQIVALRRKLRSALADAGERLRGAPVHLFYAGPTSGAVLFGQLYNPRMNGPCRLYEYGAQRDPQYRHVLTLTEENVP
jgi:hypothetical protein